MAIDNKTIETEKKSSFNVILVKRDGVNKFVSKEFYSCFPCTVLLNKAKRFYSEKSMQEFIDEQLNIRNDIKFIKTVKVLNTLCIWEEI
ncbi:MAG: hypothetical protein PHT02_00970 [Tissierellia bacterium]|nr:hypothetical protein [Tissierellia bacterium]